MRYYFRRRRWRNWGIVPFDKVIKGGGGGGFTIVVSNLLLGDGTDILLGDGSLILLP